ncbi:hypothetical protein, partial [uncultured Aeromicrobium sp.]|uniref:hypothetical protein n=1 Tax=uncultured Aeromicrobium sp. TaxID=337820 RepID=UPI0025D2C9E6
MSSAGSHRATTLSSTRGPGGARRRRRRRGPFTSPLLVGVLSLGVAGGGVTLTGDAPAPSTGGAALVTNQFASNFPEATGAVEMGVDGTEGVHLQPLAPRPRAPHAPEEQQNAEQQAADGDVSSKTPATAPHEPTAESGVAAPDPTPLTSSTSPLAARLQAQALADESGAPGLASALLPP